MTSSETLARRSSSPDRGECSSGEVALSRADRFARKPIEAMVTLPSSAEARSWRYSLTGSRASSARPQARVPPG